MPALTLELDIDAEIFECAWCDTETGETFETDSGESLCRACASDLSTCDRCDNLSEDLAYVVDNGQSVCSECADRYDTCGDCSRLCRDTYDTESGRNVCDQCRWDYNACEDCSTLISCGDYCDSCEEYRHDGHESINDYSYSPSPEFHGTGPMFLGLELEIETSYRDASAQTALDALGELAYLKEDGSLDGGFEIVTHPMSFAYAMDHFPWRMLDDLDRSGAYAGATCGLHVHVSRAAFAGPAHVYRWLKLFYRNQSDVARVARRNSQHWAAFTDSGRANVKDAAKGDRCADRYQAINVQNRATFELRVFASSLDAIEVQAALGLAAASVEYTRSISTADIAQRDAWSWDAFTRWVSARPEYASLAQEMTA